MTKTSRLYIYVLMSVAVFIGTGWIIKAYIVTPTFTNLEERYALEQAMRVYSSMNLSGAQVSAMLSDWNNWDATYQFAQDRNQKFIDENLRDLASIEREMHINLIYIYNNAGDVLVGKTLYQGSQNNLKLNGFTDGTIFHSGLIQRVLQTGRPERGVLATPYGLLLLSAASVLKTDGSGPGKGVLVFGRVLDSKQIEKIQQEFSLKFSLIFSQSSQLNNSERTLDTSLVKGERRIVRVTDDVLLVYEALTDMYGKRIGLVKTQVMTDFTKMAETVLMKTLIVIGIIILVLLGLMTYNKKRENTEILVKKKDINIPLYITITVGVLVSIGISLLLYQKKQNAISDKFNRFANAQIASIKEKLTLDLEELEEIKRFYGGSNTVTRSEFREFVRPYLKNSNFQAIEWVPEVKGSERKTFEKLAILDGIENFTFTELNPEGKKIRAREQSVYYPVYFVEPQESNREALGYAPTHLPMRSAAIQKAKSTALPIVTGPFRLIQETGNQKGLMVFVPIDKAIAFRSQEKEGIVSTSFIACVYRVDDMIKSATVSEVSDLLNIVLLDISEGSVIALTSGATTPALDEEFRQVEDFTFAGRNYRIQIAANQKFFDLQRDPEYIYALIGGLLITFFIALYFNEILSQKARAEEMVANRTSALQQSESRYQAFITQSNEGICRIELDEGVHVDLDYTVFVETFLNRGYFAECNEVFAAQLGFSSAAEVSGRKFRDVVLWEQPAMITFLREFHANNFRHSDYELTYTNVQGQNIVLKENITGIIEDGYLVRVWGNQSDITERKNAELALIESEQHFRTLAENSPEIISRFDKNLCLLYSNSGAGSIANLGQPANVGKTLREMGLTGALLETVESSITAVFTSKKPFRTELMLSKEGLWLDWLLFPEFDANGEVKEVISSARDITDLKNAEEELRKERDRAEESDRLKSAFLANMSHEIRTPMNAIMGFSELLEDEEISGEEKSFFIKKLRRRTTDLLNLINDILDISKIEAEQITLFEAPCDLSKILIDIGDVFSGLQLVEKKEIELTLNNELPSGTGSVILDENRLKQVLINVINNAYKFTENGSIMVTCSKPDAKHIQFEISDTGIGIAEEKQESIFDRFRQGDDESFSKKFGGTGLGLAIVKGLMEKMGGVISLRSKVNTGTVITLLLPYKPEKAAITS